MSLRKLRIQEAMAIVRMGDSGVQLERRVGLKAAKKAARHPPEKHAAKKHAAKKHAGKKQAGKKAAKHLPEKHAAKKHAGRKAAKKSPEKVSRKAAGPAAEKRLLHGVERTFAQEISGSPEHQKQLERAFHHLQRAAAVISLLEHESGEDLRLLLENGISLYRKATGTKGDGGVVKCAYGLLRAAEHLGMAGLYTARSEYRVTVAPPPRKEVERHLEELMPRLDKLDRRHRENGRRLEAMARELLRRGEAASHDPHLEYELTMAAEGICTALEEGL